MINEDSSDLILLGNSIPLPEEDLDEYYDGQIEEEALFGYYYDSILQAIGTPQFQSVYEVSIKEILLQPIENQIQVCVHILNKFEEVYDFTFPYKFNTESSEFTTNVYQFIEFIEYNNEYFILEIWKQIGGFKEPCEMSFGPILKAIEMNLKNFKKNGIIFEFLRTNKRQNLIKWFCEATKKHNTSIKIMFLRKGE